MAEYRHVVRKWVKPEDLNQHGTLFGGRLLQWIDEDAAIVAMVQLGTQHLVTRYISEIDFVASAVQGDLLELEFTLNAFGRTSITLSCNVENAVTGATVLRLDRIVFVGVDDNGNPVVHGQTEAITGTTRLRKVAPTS
ncbi:MAG: acyl-CoA thioesterase [Leucobacter sp.]